MAHISVTLGYIRLLQHLSTWQIDLNIVDHMGSTALHYAYLFIQEDCARLLIASGADPFILDDLGRSPSSLHPSLEIGLHPPVEIGGDSSTSSADFTSEMSEDTKDFLVQQRPPRIEDERVSEMRGVSPTRFRRDDVWSQSNAASTTPTNHSADERVGRVMDRQSFSSTIQSPQGIPTLVAPHQMETLCNSVVLSGVLSPPAGTSDQTKMDGPGHPEFHNYDAPNAIPQNYERIGSQDTATGNAKSLSRETSNPQEVRDTLKAPFSVPNTPTAPTALSHTTQSPVIPPLIRKSSTLAQDIRQPSDAVQNLDSFLSHRAPLGGDSYSVLAEVPSDITGSSSPSPALQDSGSPSKHRSASFKAPLLPAEHWLRAPQLNVTEKTGTQSGRPSSTQPTSPKRFPNVPGTPPIQLASFTRTPPRQLRSPRAEAIWAAIVDSPPDPPLFRQSDPKPTPAPAPLKPKRAPKPAPSPTPTPTLPPLDPIYLLRFQPMTPIWNALPTGTFWEFARYALREKLDFRRLKDKSLIPSLIGWPNEPKKSNVQGIEEIYAWEEGNHDAKLCSEDTRWAQELDWEAEAMVEGKGRMLGIGVDGEFGDKYGTRYGGRVGFCALLKCEGNDGPLNLDLNAQITLDKPMMRGSSLFTRVWGSHRFLRLKISKPLLNRVSRDQSGRLVKELKQFCARPIHILGREYHPLVEKENTVYYFLHGRDRIGLKAVEDAGGDRKKLYGMGRYIGTLEGLIQWWLAPEYNRDQIMSKLTSRLHLGLSDTLPGVFVKPENVKIIPDISTFHRQYSIQILVALIITLQNAMASLSPTGQGWNRFLSRERVGGNITRTTIRHHPLPRFVLEARKESSKSTRKTSKRSIFKDRTRSPLPSLWPKSSMALASLPGVLSTV